LSSIVKYQAGRVTHTVESDDPDPDEDGDGDQADDAALADGTAVASHRPGFRTITHASDSIAHAQKITNDVLLDEVYAEHAKAEATRYKGDSGLGGDPTATGVPDKPRSTDAASIYEQYDAAAATQYMRAK
jgi:hypothetical protein